MREDLFRLVPPEAPKMLLTLFLSFLLGLEREEHKAVADHYSFGGVRTYPLIGSCQIVVAKSFPPESA